MQKKGLERFIYLGYQFGSFFIIDLVIIFYSIQRGREKVCVCVCIGGTEWSYRCPCSFFSNG